MINWLFLIKICFVWKLPSYPVLSHMSQPLFHLLQPAWLLLHSALHKHPQLLHGLKDYLLWATCRSVDNSVWRRGWLKFRVPLDVSEASPTALQGLLLHGLRLKKWRMLMVRKMTPGSLTSVLQSNMAPSLHSSLCMKLQSQKTPTFQLFSRLDEKHFPFQPELNSCRTTAVSEVPWPTGLGWLLQS